MRFIDRSRHSFIIEIALKHLVDSPNERSYFIDLLKSSALYMQNDLTHRFVEECVKVQPHSKAEMLVGLLTIIVIYSDLPITQIW
jgi:hypothetical protein